MKRRTGFGLALVVLLALLGSQPVLAGPQADDAGDNKSTEKTGGGLNGGFKVFDNESLQEVWIVTCNNGSQALCQGDVGGCLEFCEWYCGGPCIVVD